MIKKYKLQLIIVLISIIFVFTYSIISNSNSNNESIVEKGGKIYYKSDKIEMEIENIKEENNKLDMWVVNLKLQSADSINSAFAKDEFSMDNKQRTSKIAKKNDAVLAINGAAAGFNERGFVIRDKVIYRETTFDCAPLVIKENGDLEIYGYGEKTGQELLDLGAIHTYDYGPDLIRNGEIVDYGEDWYKNNKDPRTVIGQKDPLEYVIIVVDGRSNESEGLSHYDTAVELKERGCYVGYNLDGGGSTTLYFNGKVLNNPSDIFGERRVSDILYFK